eukprot:1142263-Pelagomonas_calceolata.AAC.1
MTYGSMPACLCIMLPMRRRAGLVNCASREDVGVLYPCSLLGVNQQPYCHRKHPGCWPCHVFTSFCRHSNGGFKSCFPFPPSMPSLCRPALCHREGSKPTATLTHQILPLENVAHPAMPLPLPGRAKRKTGAMEKHGNPRPAIVSSVALTTGGSHHIARNPWLTAHGSQDMVRNAWDTALSFAWSDVKPVLEFICAFYSCSASIKAPAVQDCKDNFVKQLNLMHFACLAFKAWKRRAGFL